MQSIKKCSKCLTDKPLNQYTKHSSNASGIRSYCKTCAVMYNKKRLEDPEKMKRQKLYLQEYRKSDEYKIKQKEFGSIYKKLHADELREKSNTPESKQKVSQYAKKYYEKNKSKILARRNDPKVRERIRQYDNKRRERIDIRISQSISRGIRISLKNGKNGRKWESVTGYNIEDLIKHLESKFTTGMNWNNYGEWEIDHIKPISSFTFDSADCEEFKACWSINNLQPLWRSENRSKSNHFNSEIILSNLLTATEELKLSDTN